MMDRFSTRGTRRTDKPAAAQSRYTRRPVARALLALAGFLAVMLAACAPDAGSAPQLAQTQVFTWPYLPPAALPTIQRAAVLDPATLTFANDSGTANMLYSGLVTFDSRLHVVPDTATFEVDTTGTIYTFHLKHNLHFSDGKPLTAADYAYSINRALDPTLCTVLDAQTYGPTTDNGECSATPEINGDPSTFAPPVGSNYLSYILGADARLHGKGGADQSLIATSDDPKFGLNVLDPYTLRIRLKNPVAFFLEALTYPTSFPVEQALVEKYPGGAWVDHLDEGGCSGPFMVKSYDNGKQLRLVPNPQWAAAFGKKLTLTEVDRPLMTDDTTEYANYRGGQYDFTVVPDDQYPFAHGQDDFNEVPTLVTQYFGLNVEKPPFDNVQVRRAFDLALNKQFLVDGIVHGAEIPSNHIVPLGMPGYFGDLKNPPPDSTQSVTGNQAAAKALLQQVIDGCKTRDDDWCPYVANGAKSQPITFWTGTSNHTRADILTAAVGQWQQVLNLNVVAKPDKRAFPTCLPLHGPCQGWAVGWLADYPDPQDFLTLQFTTGAANNGMNASDPKLDGLLPKADVEQNAAQRFSMYNDAEQEAVNYVAWIPYAQNKLFWRQRTWVRGFGLNALQLMVDQNWPNVYIVEH